jgi:predicted nucleotidyltransferase component of viral defense system
MLNGYGCTTLTDFQNALRDILQQLALLGLWRGKFFEHAAFYGGTALRMLHGLDRFSEDLDFSLLRTDNSFSMGTYGEALRKEIDSFGFKVEFESPKSTGSGQIESAFLKANTYKQLIAIDAGGELLRSVHPEKILKIKLEVDTDPPGGFETETQYVFHPIPFPIRAYSLPDLFAGKLHAVLCRKWRKRVKGRDWYDMVWYVGHYPAVNISHLEIRMKQSGDYLDENELTITKLRFLLLEAIDDLNIDLARKEVSRFVRDPRALDVWSKEFFQYTIRRIKPV